MRHLNPVLTPAQPPKASPGAKAGYKPPASANAPEDEPFSIDLDMGEQFEECLEMKWKSPEPVREFYIEMVIDRSGKAVKPAKDAMVKKVSMGRDKEGCIQNMPEGRNFLVRVLGKLNDGKAVYSPWKKAATLSPDTRDKDLGNLDPMNMPRMNCNNCPCACYVPFRWGLNSPGRLRCRRCGCHHTEHQMVEIGEILKARETKAKGSMNREVTPLPHEALDWDERECLLWFWSQGAVHPRNVLKEANSRSKPGLANGGVKGRVSIVTPTTEMRHKFHEQLFRCFEAQTWPDKELVIVETYWESYSDFFSQKAQTDPRVVYVKYKQQARSDWSIGLKRNVGTHLASGEFIASFDDDDLYAPSYLNTMVSALEHRRALAVKLSNWYVYHMDSDAWSFCDPIAWGLTKGLDETSDKVKSWAYGYGFSYVYRRQAGLDLWYNDINLGEDFNFMMQLQIRRGERSVHLVPDDFGMCLHVQHGGNTSNSIPLREVPDTEAMDLDVMELNAWMHASGPAGKALSKSAGRSRSSGNNRKVLCYLPGGKRYQVDYPPKATVKDFLASLGDQICVPCADYKVYRVPPMVAFGGSGGTYTNTQRDEVAANVLGIAFLAELPGAEENLRPDTKSGQQWCKLLKAAQAPVRGAARLGPRTSEVWVLSPDAAAAAGYKVGEETWEDDDKEACEAAEEESKLSFVTRVTCQSSTVKKFFAAKQSFGVWLRKGATVVDLRWVLGRHLPAEARVLCQREGRDIQALQETDHVPDEVIVSDFRGSRSFYMRFTNKQCAIVLRFMRSFFRNPENQKRLDDFESTAKGTGHDYRAQLVQLLAHEVYPRIYQKFHVPVMDDLDGPKLMLEAMSNVSSSNLQVCELWMEVEMLMRNKASAQQALSAVMYFKELQAKESAVGAALAKEQAPENEKPADAPTYESVREVVGLLQKVADGWEQHARQQNSAEATPPQAGEGSKVADPKDAPSSATAGDQLGSATSSVPTRPSAPPPMVSSLPEAALKELPPVASSLVKAAAENPIVEKQLRQWVTLASNSGTEEDSSDTRPNRTEAATPAQPIRNGDDITKLSTPSLPAAQKSAERPANGHQSQAVEEKEISSKPAPVSSPRTQSSLLDWDALEKMEKGPDKDAVPEVAMTVPRAPVLVAPQKNSESSQRIDPVTQRNDPVTPAPGSKQKDKVDSLRVQVLVRHGTRAGEALISVPPTATMLQVKMALIRFVGRTAEALQRMQLVERTGNTFKQFPDEELLGERRELLVLGLGLPEAKEGKEENENPPTVNLSYAQVPVSVHNVLTSDAVTLMLPEVATMKQVKAALKQHGKPEFTKLLSNGASLYVLSGTNEEVPLPEEEPLRGRWHLMLGCDRASVC